MARPSHGPTPAEIGRVHIEVRVRAKPEKVFRSIVEKADKWWPDDMRMFGKKGTLDFPPDVGAPLVERGPGGAAILWGQVIALEPPGTIEWAGLLSPRFGGPALSLIHLDIKQVGEHTTVRLDDAILGPHSVKLHDQLREGWTRILDALRDHLEASTRTRKKPR